MANYSKLKVTWRNNLNNIYKENTIIGVGQEAVINMSENSISLIYVNFKVDNDFFTDLVEINGNVIQVPFKTDVLKVGTHQLEIVAYLKNGDIVPSPTFSYYVEKSLENVDAIKADTHYPILIELLEKVEEWNEKIPYQEEQRIANENERIRKEIERQNAEELRQIAYNSLYGRIDELEESTAYYNVNIYGVYGDGVTNYTSVIADIPNDKPLYFPPGEYILDTPPNNKCFGYGATLIVENGYIMRLDTKPLEVNSIWQNTIRLNNTDLGINAGKKLGASNYGNVAIGNNALQTAESRTIKNVAIGHNALSEGTWIYQNTVLGTDACRNTTMGERNTVVGSNAGLTLGSDNLVGVHYFYRTDNDVSELDTLWPEWREYVGSTDSPNIIPTQREDVKGNTAVGRNSLGWTIKPLYCTAIGYNALEKAIDGSNMVSIGVNNSYNTIKATNTTSVGTNANVDCSTTFGDVSVGYGAMGSMPHGEYNTAIGYQSMAGVSLIDRNQTFKDNVAVGRFTISNSNNGVTNNVAVGVSALRYANGSNNVAIGYQALSNISSDNNVAIGYRAGYELTNASYATALGMNALSNKTCDGYTNITGVGNNSTVSGDNQVQLGNATANPYAFNALQLRSDERDKVDIVDLKIGLDFINALRPVEYRMNIRESYIDYDEHGEVINNVNDGSRAGERKHSGLIAQDVKRVLDDIGVDYAMYQDHKVNGGKDVLSLGYEELIAPLIKAIQELTVRINKLEKGE